MLKHLLSSGTNADQLDPPQQYNAYPIKYKYEHDSPPVGADNTPNKIVGYEQQPQPNGYTPSELIPSTNSANNNNIVCHEPVYSTMNDELGNGYDPISNTSDFLSSTFSLLTSDTLDQSSNGEWSQYSLDHLENKTQRVFYDPNQQIYYQPNAYPSQNHQYLNGSQHEEQLHQQQMHEMQNLNQGDEPPEKRPKKASGPSARNCQLEYTENFKRFINIPTQVPNAPITSTANSATTPQRSISANNSDSGVQSPADSDESDSNSGSQNIQCPACKSVYSSPRSLTGHIGRTEKCRELIGRDYLEEIAKMGKSGCIPDPSAGEGISPVCPHCNRFISHYKGNIRRHINSCKKIPGRKDSEISGVVEPAGSNSSNASLASYDTTSTPNPNNHAHHDDQPCSSTNKDLHSDYSLQNMHSHQMHQQHVHAVHFAHPEERHHHVQPINHHLPPYHLMQTAPIHHSLQAPPHQLITHLQPTGSHPMHQHLAYAMEYMPTYEPMHHPHIPPQQTTQQYEITYVRTPPENPPHTAVSATNNSETPTAPKLPKLKHNGMVPVNDPYYCQWCSFSTVYKGNMKRHLISCHNCTDELLRKYNFELERLRKSNPHPANTECLPFIEIKPPQPPGTRRPRNPPSNKSLGRPKKRNSPGDDKNDVLSSPFEAQQMKPEYIMEPQLQYNVLQPPQQHIKIDYQPAPMGFMSANGQLLHPAPGNPQTYIIKDCANDSGLGIDLTDYGDVALHQPQALPGY